MMKNERVLIGYLIAWSRALVEGHVVFVTTECVVWVCFGAFIIVFDRGKLLVYMAFSTPAIRAPVVSRLAMMAVRDSNYS